jgi:hypothetical protein
VNAEHGNVAARPLAHLPQRLDARGIELDSVEAKRGQLVEQPPAVLDPLRIVDAW